MPGCALLSVAWSGDGCISRSSDRIGRVAMSHHELDLKVVVVTNNYYLVVVDG